MAREVIKRYVPQALSDVIRPLLWFVRQASFFRKPELRYLETHLADHCNLNCKGCSHFSPIARKELADVRQYEKDIHRLSRLFRNIRRIRLMGGEPLLHPDVALFIVSTRAAFPGAEVVVVTNGILVAKASPAFWEACRNAHAIVEITVYPPMAPRVAECRALCAAEKVELLVSEMRPFTARLNLQGDSDERRAFVACRSSGFFCPFLRNGRIHNCYMSALVHYFAGEYGQAIAADKGFDIHSRFATGLGVLWRLNRPIATCQWCTCRPVRFAWGVSRKLREEWEAVAR